ncbi:transcription elongation regulator [Coemansia sp. RSA 1822]|nr:transcription elongation regulator [Coemansia sp. RSA 638]KAJ2539642.1 transcription elongation regulator [Coemansia sp. RSA 1853]KAJ2562934.1 transcription elongation regulator [Coemansia sp. RSA 1822]
MEFVPGRPPLPPPEAIIAAGHEWAVFLAPADPQLQQHTPNEPYYYERKNGITTWIRPFDYVEPTDPNNPDAALEVGRKWQQAESERKRHAARIFAKQDTAVSQQHIDDTPWRRVETKQNRVFYYNNDTKESRWDQPVQVTEALQAMAEKEKEQQAEGTEMNVDDAEWMLEQMQDEDMSDNEPVGTHDANALPQVDERIALLDKPERIVHFKSMLHEAKVDPFGTWDSELDKVANDWRLTAITDDAERGDLFDAVCAEIIERRNRERKHEPLVEKSSDPFGELLRESVVKKTSFAKFCQRNLKDPRYLSIKTSREREKRFVKHLESVVGVNK